MVNQKIKRLMTDTRQLSRLVLALGALLVLAVISFGAYYYYDRYYTTTPATMEEALRQAEQALIDDPQNTEKRLVLAEMYLFNNRYGPAIQSASQVMLAEPENQRAWLVLGMGYVFQGQPDAAVEPLARYVAANQDSDMPGLNKPLQAAAYYLGDSYLQLGQPEKAVAPLEQAVRWSKTDADAMVKLGMAYTALREYDGALQMFSYATAFVPDYQEAYQGMLQVFTLTQQADYARYAEGMLAYSKKDYAGAVRLLSQSAQGLTDFAPNHAGLGLAYEAQGALQDAQTAFKTALQLDPKNQTALHGLQRTEILLKE